MRTQQTQSSDDLVLSTKHLPVLLQEVLDGLSIESNDTVFDGTLGGCGHASASARKLSKDGIFIGTDVDSTAIIRAKKVLKDISAKLILSHSNFRDIENVLNENNIQGIDKTLLDLGWSSDQIERDGYGMSFQKDEPLSMILSDIENPDALSAHEIVNNWQEGNLADIIYGWGGEKYARRIAKKIVEQRIEQPIDTTFQLVEIIRNATPFSYHHARIHPATRTFQALRIAVNDELRALEDALDVLLGLTKQNGRIAIISFHSTEDRIVKRRFKKWKEEKLGESLTKKPMTASEEELKNNPRARSAKLRIFKKN